MPQVIIVRHGVQENWVGGPVKGHSDQEYTTYPVLKNSHGSSVVLPRMPGFGGLYQGMLLPHRTFFEGLTCAACTACHSYLTDRASTYVGIFGIEADIIPVSSACTIRLVLLLCLLEGAKKI